MINWVVLTELADKPHPLLNIAEDFEKQIRETPLAWMREVFTEARTVHHLLDMVGIPHGQAYAQDLDARTYLAIAEILKMRRQLDRITSWHSQAVEDEGMISGLCNECGDPHPCETRRMANGSHEDLTEGEE